jgi:hypothetical protein
VARTRRLVKILQQTKVLAREYYRLTGRPLGVTGEIAEYEAVRLLGLELSPVRQPGFDAIRHERGRASRIQIKGRCVLPGAKRGQRLGGIDISKPFDSVVLVLLNEYLDATEIYEAPRHKVRRALLAPGSRTRNERGALAISKFKRIGQQIWPRRQAA